MRRKLVLVGVPVLVLVVWALGSAVRSHADAEVDITSAHPIVLRSTVVASVTSFGGERVSENTDFDDGGSSQLNFKVPTARLEQATEALAQLSGGNHVTHQSVDLPAASNQAGGVTQKIADAQSCVASVSGVATAAARALS